MSEPDTSSYELAFTIGPRMWLTANGRYHYRQKAARTKLLRHCAYTAATHARNKGEAHAWADHHRALVTATIGYPTAARADPDNAQPTVKALIDGLTDAGLWTDDDYKHVAIGGYRRDTKKAPRNTHTVRLHISHDTTDPE